MRTAIPNRPASTRSHRPRAITVFAAAFIAGAAAAVGVNRALDVRLAQLKPRVESETIFVALRSLPQGSPVTVWDVGLRDWPKAMMPSTALRANDTFSGLVLKHPLREGQPLLSIQLAEAASGPQIPGDGPAYAPPRTATQSTQTTEADLWSPAQPASTASVTPAPKAGSPIVPAAMPASVPSTPTAGAIPAAIAAAPLADGGSADVAVSVAPASDANAAAAITAAAIPAAAIPAAAIPAVAIPPIAIPPVVQADTAVPVTQPAMPAVEAVAVAPAVNETATMSPSEPVAPQAGLVAITDTAITDSDLANSALSPEATPVAMPIPAPEPIPAVAAAVVPLPAPEAATPPASTSSAPESPAERVVHHPVARPRSPSAFQSESVVAQPPIPLPAPQPVERPQSVAVRYLVVPESIAVQADTSFAVRPDAVQQTDDTQTQQPHPMPRVSSNAVRPLPGTETARRTQRPNGQQGVSGQQGGQPSRTGNQPTPATGTPATDPENQPRFGSMFPNLSAGIDAIERELSGSRRERTEQAEQPAASRPRPQY
ncbi:MAG: hypothetical protein HQ464_10520 [Planctomycetes bacterium]|nr:hypothetical protein [Planctomycetota bacterium]